MRQLLESPWGWKGTGCQGNHHGIRGVEFSALLLTPGEERRVGDWFSYNSQWFSNSCLQSEPHSPIKTLTRRIEEFPAWDTFERCWEVAYLKKAWCVCSPSHVPCPMHLSHLAVPGLHPFIVKWWASKWTVFLSSVSCNIKPQKGIWESQFKAHGNPDLLLVDRCTGGNLGLVITIWSGNQSVGLSPDHVGSNAGFRKTMSA